MRPPLYETNTKDVLCIYVKNKRLGKFNRIESQIHRLKKLTFDKQAQTLNSFDSENF